MSSSSIKDPIANMVRVTHWPDGNLWPEGNAHDFTAFHSRRHDFSHTRLDGRAVSWSYRFYDPYAAYAGESLPSGQPRQGRAIDNVHWVPSQRVFDRMVADLEAISKECSVLWWDSAIQCFPQVAQHLRRLFRLSILSFGDDLPGSSDVKTFPVASCFDALTHAMYTWDFPSGQSVPQVYASRGLADCRFIAWGPMQQVYDDVWFENKVRALRIGTLPIDLVWVGNYGIAPHRKDVLRSIVDATGDLKAKFYGNLMRDGRWAGTPADLYAQSVFGLNVPESSFFNGRFADLFMSGTIQVVHDPHGEFARFGFVDGQHYLSYDGTGEDLVRRVREFQNRGDALASIAIAARAKFLEYRAKYDDAEVVSGILLDYGKQIREGRP